MEQWKQANIMFPNWGQAERSVIAHIAPLLTTTEAEGLVNAWFFIRKHPVWRVRYSHPAAAGGAAQDRIGRHLDGLIMRGHIAEWSSSVYEPEVHAFGGAEAMDASHRFFHRDSAGFLAHLSRTDAGADHRRELSLLLCTLMLRAASQDWYEQGDTWARVSAHRDQPAGVTQEHAATLSPAVRRLLSTDIESQLPAGRPFADLAGWAGAYQAAGRELADLNAMGRLHRGLRDVLAHHVIFAWNRLGLPYEAQAVIAAAAKAVVFGPDPAQAKAG